MEVPSPLSGWENLGEEGLWDGWRWAGSRTTADRRRVSRKGDSAEQISPAFYEDVTKKFQRSFYFVLLWVSLSCNCEMCVMKSPIGNTFAFFHVFVWPRCSCMAFSDGQTAAMMVAAQASQGPTADLSSDCWYTMDHRIRWLDTPNNQHGCHVFVLDSCGINQCYPMLAVLTNFRQVRTCFTARVFVSWQVHSLDLLIEYTSGWLAVTARSRWSSVFRTTSESMTTIRGQTLVAWAPMPPPHVWQMTWSLKSRRRGSNKLFGTPPGIRGLTHNHMDTITQNI